MNQKCALCENSRVLQASHVIPKFVFRWLKKTGGEHLRKADNPNKRVNDGIKIELLCRDCEQKFGKLEDRFAREIFHPYVNEGNQIFEYDIYLFQFAISVLWRVALHSIPRLDFHHGSAIESTIIDWREFLMADKAMPKADRIHIFFTSDSLKQNTQPVERFLNYWARSVDGTIATGTNSCVVYAKMARVILIGEISSFDSVGMVNTRIGYAGRIVPDSMKINSSIKEFLVDRVMRINSMMEGISENQKNIAIENTEEQLWKMKGSDIWNIARREQKMSINPDNLDF